MLVYSRSKQWQQLWEMIDCQLIADDAEEQAVDQSYGGRETSAIRSVGYTAVLKARIHDTTRCPTG